LSVMKLTSMSNPSEEHSLNSSGNEVWSQFQLGQVDF
jgi:hypothetical protein